MLSHKLWVLIIDMSAQPSVKLNKPFFITKVAEPIHDLFQFEFLCDLIRQHIIDQ